MAISVPSGVTSGTTITEAWGDSVAAAIAYLASPPSCRLTHSVDQSFNDATEGTVAFNTDVYDPSNMHDTVTLNSRLVFNDAGVYVVSFSCILTAGADYNDTYAYFRLNGSGILAIGGTEDQDASFEPRLQIHMQHKFAAADYIEVRLFQDNTAAAARNVLSLASYTPILAATWLGLGT